MIRVNLLPIREEARQRDLRQQLVLLLLFVVGEVVAFTTWYTRAEDVVRGAEAELSAAEQVTAELEREAGTLEKLQLEEDKLRAKAEIVEIIDRLRGNPAEVMMHIAKNIPNRVWLIAMSFYPIPGPMNLRDPVLQGGARVSADMLPKLAAPIFAVGMRGYAMGPSDVTDFAKNMKGSSLFDHVEFGEVKEVLYEEAEIPVQEFELFARLAGWEEHHRAVMAAAEKREKKQ
jgi:Tfp pilus assembly protein PilN